MLKVSDDEAAKALDDAMEDVLTITRWGNFKEFPYSGFLLRNLKVEGYEIVKKEPTDGE